MMGPELPALGREFVSDHQHMIKAISRLLEALRAKDVAAASRIAAELNVIAGPHIQFEEKILYPEVAKVRGQQTAARLYAEHQVGLHAVSRLLGRDPGLPLTDAEQKQLSDEMQTMLDHAVSCGTLLSHITTLDEARQSELLDQLQGFRRHAPKWTEVPSAAQPGDESPK